MTCQTVDGSIPTRTYSVNYFFIPLFQGVVEGCAEAYSEADEPLAIANEQDFLNKEDRVLTKAAKVEK